MPVNNHELAVRKGLLLMNAVTGVWFALKNSWKAVQFVFDYFNLKQNPFDEKNNNNNDDPNTIKTNYPEDTIYQSDWYIKTTSAVVSRGIDLTVIITNYAAGVYLNKLYFFNHEAHNALLRDRLEPQQSLFLYSASHVFKNIWAAFPLLMTIPTTVYVTNYENDKKNLISDVKKRADDSGKVTRDDIIDEFKEAIRLKAYIYPHYLERAAAVSGAVWGVINLIFLGWSKHLDKHASDGLAAIATDKQSAALKALFEDLENAQSGITGLSRASLVSSSLGGPAAGTPGGDVLVAETGSAVSAFTEQLRKLGSAISAALEHTNKLAQPTSLNADVADKAFFDIIAEFSNHLRLSLQGAAGFVRFGPAVDVAKLENLWFNEALKHSLLKTLKTNIVPEEQLGFLEQYFDCPAFRKEQCLSLGVQIEVVLSGECKSTDLLTKSEQTALMYQVYHEEL